jgi:hypothetical protein
MNLDEYRTMYPGDAEAPGWAAIDAALKTVYPHQVPLHFAPRVRAIFGGPDPLDGISAYRTGAGRDAHWHFVTYGFSNLYYDENAAGGDFSGKGFELTMRLLHERGEAGPPAWAMNMLQNIARYVFNSGRGFEPGHYMPANGPLRLGPPTALMGAAFAIDPELGVIETPHGEVKFLQLFGVTQDELDRMKNVDRDAVAVLDEHRRTNPLLITDMTRS